MKHPIKALFFIAINLGLYACSSVSHTEYFVLATATKISNDLAVSQTQQHQTSTTINITAINLPGYLHDSGIALETNAHQIQHANYHRWAEKLDEGIKRSLRDALEQQLSETNQTINVALVIRYFHGDANGLVVLDTDWQARTLPKNKTNISCSISGRYTHNKKQATSGYQALVVTQASLIKLLAIEIASAINNKCH